MNMENFCGIVREGWLKRVKNEKRRYFVLCFDKITGAAQLQYYDNEKKFQSNLGPKKTLLLRDCLGIICKEDAKHGQVLILYRRDQPFAVTTDDKECLKSWFIDLDKLHKMENKYLQESKYDLVWNVLVLSRGLGGVKNMTGAYKLCLKDETLYFVNADMQDVFIESKLCHIRRYGHMDDCFFMEFGRSSSLGAGEIWMQVEDTLIAQKIHETLARSVTQSLSPAPADVYNNNNNNSDAKKEARAHRHSMIHMNAKNYNNNPQSPKARRSTFMSNVTNVIAKVKETTRPHSKSISGDGSAEHELYHDNKAELVDYVNQPARRSEVDANFAQLLAPLSPRRTSKSSLPSDNITSIDEDKESIKKESKSTEEKAHENDYTFIKPKRRSVTKQDCSAVRLGYAAEQRRAHSLPRRPSDTTERRLSNTSSKTADSDKESNGERRRSCDLDENLYFNLGPYRTRITSDSSLEDTTNTLMPQYTPMGRPRPIHSSRDHMSNDDSSLYINMSPGEDGVFRPTISSTTSNEETSTEETFDHLTRFESSSGSPVHHGNGYVDMHRRGADSKSRALKKTNSDVQRPSNYVNVNINRSRSVGNKTKRPKPVFEILPETNTDSDDEGRRRPQSSYVNVETKTSLEKLSLSEEDLQYSNFTPVTQSPSEPRKNASLNYASVSFVNDSPTENTSPRNSRLGRRSPSNYSKVDFQKSRGLAEMSSSRERQLQGIH